MFDPDRYIPILTGKAGELVALGNLSPGARMGLTPLLDIPPVPREHPPRPGARETKKKRPLTPIGEMTKVLERLVRTWGRERAVLIDLDGYERYRLQTAHPLSWTVERARRRGLRITPVVSTRSTAEYVEAAGASKDHVADLVLRLHYVPNVDTVTGATSALHDLATKLNLLPTTTDVIIDLGRLPTDTESVVPEVAELARAVEADWRSSALASTGLPVFHTLRALHEQAYLRNDWRLWKELRETHSVDVAFSDYAITGPRPEHDDPPYGPAAHLRYTRDDLTWVYKGRKTDTDRPPEPGTTYPDLCKKLLKARIVPPGTRVYCGRSYSWGDRSIWLYSRREPGAGTPQQFIQFAANHHLTHVVNQIEAL